MIAARMHGFHSVVAQPVGCTGTMTVTFDSADRMESMALFIPNGSAVIEDGKLIIDLKKATGR